MNFLLNKLNISSKQIDYIVFNDDLESVVSSIPNLCMNRYKINHHLAHLYSSFHTSNFDKAAVLIADGAGSKKNLEDKLDETRETTSSYFADRDNIKLIRKLYGTLDGDNPKSQSQTVMSNSLGEFYRVVAETIGLGWLSGPGKMMGMSSYGKAVNDDRYINYLNDSIEFLDNGEFIIKTNGENGLIDRLYSLKQQITNAKDKEFEHFAALANSAQIIFEKLLIHTLTHLHDVTKTDNLCFAGGAALNSIANSIISKYTNFKNVHIVAYPGDNGLAIGAALWGYINRVPQSNITRKKLDGSPILLSKNYDNNEILEALSNSGLYYEELENELLVTAKHIYEGKVVGWFQGMSEFGPRALGNRSILGNPCDAKIRDHINFNIKSREWFRPLAPAVLEEKADIYFDINCKSEWMQFVAPVKKDFRNILPAITHVDGSARLQTVSLKNNSKFYNLIKEFEKLSGIPILLNTSFNILGKPIVETPKDAIEAFKASNLDIMVLGNILIRK